jgi:hypothetical protein
MEYLAIRNSRDLKAEIFRLEELSKQQGATLRSHFSSPGAIFSTIFSMFSKPSAAEDEKSGGIFSQDFLGLISRFVLPLALNKTIFKNSNFLVKALVGLVSQKASHYISEDSVGSVWHKVAAAFEGHSGGIIDKVKSLFADKKQKKAANHPAHTSAQQNVLKTDR